MSSRTEQGVLIDLPDRGRRGARRWPRRVAVAALVLAGALGAVAGTWRVGTVRVEGVESLSPDEVVGRSGVSGGERMLLTRLQPIEKRVAELAAVRSVDVRRRLPSTLEIVVVERRPLVRLGGTEDRVAGEDGLVFRARVDAPLPVLVGWSGTGVAGDRLQGQAPDVLAAFGGFPGSLRAATAGVDLGGGITLALHDGTEVRFGGDDELVAKGRAAARVLEDADARGVSLAYVDVRTPMTPVSRERGPGPEGENPTASPRT